MKDVLLYIWQLPQNILGLLVIFFSRAKKDFAGVYTTDCNFGVSLGNYIIVNKHCAWVDILHEGGHQKQSLYFGWFYLLVIGIPSACGNIWDRFFHKNWETDDRGLWYYSLPWEAWADYLGGVKR